MRAIPPSRKELQMIDKSIKVSVVELTQTLRLTGAEAQEFLSTGQVPVLIHRPENDHSDPLAIEADTTQH